MAEQGPDNLIRGKFPDRRPYQDRFEDQLNKAFERHVVQGEGLEVEPTLEQLRFSDPELFCARTIDVALHAGRLESMEVDPDFIQATAELRDKMWSRLTRPEKARARAELRASGYEPPED